VTSRSERRPGGLPLESADAERPHQHLVARVRGRLIRLRHAATVPWGQLLQASSNWWAFVAVLVPADARQLVGSLSWDQMAHLVRVYRIHHGLGTCAVDDQRLAGLIARYGRAIEQDLAGRGIELLALWQQRRWRCLLSLVDALPRHSAYVEALCDDDELAEYLLTAETSAADRAWTPLSQYTPELEMATNLYDRLGELIQAVTASAGARPPKIRPYPRPRTAADRIRHRRAQDRHRTLVARMLPDGPQPAPAPSLPPPPVRAAGDPLPPHPR